MKGRGTVLRIDGKIAHIKVCKGSGECQGGTCRHYDNGPIIEMAIVNMIGAEVGDKVEFNSDPKKMMAAVLLVFWFPLVFSGFGAGLGIYLAKGKLVIAALGILFLAIASLIVWLINKKIPVGTGVTATKILVKNHQH